LIKYLILQEFRHCVSYKSHKTQKTDISRTEFEVLDALGGTVMPKPPVFSSA